MNKKQKALLLFISAVLLVAVSVFGTFAYLTDKDVVTNTFTVGAVGLSLDEAEVNLDGTYKNGHDTRVKGNAYKLLPGHTYYKDPTVTVDAGSEDAYVRMIVKVERVDQLKLALPYSEGSEYYSNDGNKTFLLQALCGNWDSATWLYEGYTESENGQDGYYEFRYKEIVTKSDNATVLDDLFETITIPGEIDNSKLTYLSNLKIIVNAHAIQADGFTNADAAWAAFGE